MSRLAERLLAWFDVHGRHDLPWQHPRSAYRVWISEIMLQQTQVQTVIPYFQRFMDALPDLPALAAAPQDRVLALWSGLGYYARARNLHAAAQACVERHGGELPRDIDALVALPGIGRSTAGAILAQAHGLRAPILDGNVKRLLSRFHAVEGWPGSSTVEKQLWALAASHLPDNRLADYTQALMDFGATRCSRHQPDCADCPLRADCLAHREGRVEHLPTPRPGKALPQRETVMLLLRDPAGRVLMARRPPTGVWASLWSLPEVEGAPGDDLRGDPPGDLPGDIAAVADADFGGAWWMDPIEHVFSHFRLRIRPLQVPARERALAVGDNQRLRWQALDALDGIGLPAPIGKLLRSLD